MLEINSKGKIVHKHNHTLDSKIPQIIKHLTLKYTTEDRRIILTVHPVVGMLTEYLMGFTFKLKDKSDGLKVYDPFIPDGDLSDMIRSLDSDIRLCKNMGCWCFETEKHLIDKRIKRKKAQENIKLLPPNQQQEVYNKRWESLINDPDIGYLFKDNQEVIL